jgi:hypothetical protein
VGTDDYVFVDICAVGVGVVDCVYWAEVEVLINFFFFFFEMLRLELTDIHTLMVDFSGREKFHQ